MELVYLWVEGYKNIQKQGFNFSPRFHCEYDEEKNELTIDENDDYIENFFGDNINVTAIVGKNGSGKSSVLEYLLDSPKLILTFENNKLYLGQNINIINLTEYSVVIKKQFLEFTHMLSSDYMFNNMDILIDGTLDINDNSFTKIMKEYTVEDLSSYKKLILNQINLFVKAKNSLQELKFSKFISIGVERYNNKEIDETDLEEYMYMGAYRFFSMKSSIYTLGFDQVEDMSYKFGYNELEKIIKDNDLEEYRKLKYLCSLFEVYNTLKPKENRYFRVFDIPLQKFNENILDLIRILNEDANDWIDVKWDRKFSSGEMAFINLFSLLFSEFQEKKLLYLICIDEGESFLHPNWQKKYLSYIVQFIKDNFPNRKIHVILTTHSPFLLSDIPKQNIIFLDKNEDGACKVVDGLKEKKQTFGANIHTLLSDSFFMEDGLMGEFAKGKIDEVIDYLNGKNTKIKNDDEAQKLVNIIGEPIVKNQLQRMLDSKRLKKVDEIDAIKKSMEAMQKRLDELEK